MMFQSITRRVVQLSVLGITILGLTVLAPSQGFASGKEKRVALEKEGVELIGQLEEVARDVHYNAERLSSFRLSHVSNWTHYHHLNEIKVLINEGLKPALQRLTEIQEQLPEWHQDAIDRMLNSAKALAADTNSAIITKNEAGPMPSILHAEYNDLIAKINGHAETLVKTSDAAGEYASAHEKAVEAGLNVSKHP